MRCRRNNLNLLKRLANLRKITIVQVVGIVLFTVYVILLLIGLFTDVLGNWSRLVISITLALMSMNLISKGALIKSQSTLWFSVSLILYALLIVISELLKFEINKHYYVYSLIPIIPSLFNLAIFGNLIYIKVIILNITIIVPILLQYFLTFLA